MPRYRRLFRRLIGAFALLALALPGAMARAADAPRVVVTILPLHSLVAGVMDGVGTPHLLLPGGTSPHSYALKPSDARALARAQAVFWVGEPLEAFLHRPLATLAAQARVVEVLDMPGLVRLAPREGGTWDAAGDGQGDKAAPGGHPHGRIDAHVWLDPANARVIADQAAAALAGLDPANAPRYRANATAMSMALEQLDTRIGTVLDGLGTRPYIVFHDAYQYFERRYGLSPAGAVTVAPGRAPGARRLMALRDRVVADKAACVFIEPQFEPKTARTVIEGTGARMAVLDPLGAHLAPGKDAYFSLMRNLSGALADCLGRR